MSSIATADGRLISMGLRLILPILQVLGHPMIPSENLSPKQNKIDVSSSNEEIIWKMHNFFFYKLRSKIICIWGM